MARKEETVTIYDLENNPHLMTHLNARDMITHMGWSTVPVDKLAMANANEMLKDALAEAAAKAAVDLTAIRKELDGKSKAEMIAFAQERFGVKVDGRKAEAVIIDTILELETDVLLRGGVTPAHVAEAENDDAADEGADNSADEPETEAAAE